MKRLLEEAKRMLAINSVTSNGNEELANYVSSLMQDRGLKAQMQPVMHSIETLSKRQFNVVGILGDPLVDKKTKKGLLLSSHLDTVSPGLAANWTETGGNPFTPAIKDGKIYGLGAADAKLDLLCKLHAIERFRERKLKMPVYLVGTCGEEIGMFGAKYLIKSLALNPKFVVVGGPSGLKLVPSHKSMLLMKLAIGYQNVERDARGFNRRADLLSYGKSAHGASPELGENAIAQAFDFLHKASEHGFEIRYTHLEGGDTVNRVPDLARVQFYLTSHQLEDFKRFFREIVRAEGKESAFRVELGGLGEAGVRFLPENLFSCILDVMDFFKVLAAELSTPLEGSYQPPHSTVNYGKLSPRLGGMDLFFDIRLLPSIQPEQVEKRIQQGVQAIAARYPSLNIAAIRERFSPGLQTPEQGELVKLCQEAMEQAGIAPELHHKSTATEAAQFSQAGHEAVVFGAGQSYGNSHGPNEHIEVSQLEQAVKFYEKLIEKACL